MNTTTNSSKLPEADQWQVVLTSIGRVILTELHGESGKGAEVTDLATMGFKDEAMAKRVLEAFNHAADLCRGKEPF